MGAAMGAGLYEAAFAALVRLHGRDSRGLITGITLIAGFASTVGGPLSTLMPRWAGATPASARRACTSSSVPLNASLPRALAVQTIAQGEPSPAESAASPPPPPRTAALRSFVFAATWFTSTAMVAHFPTMMQMAGASLAPVVAAGALIGPAQVAARVLEFGLLRRTHPLLSARLAALVHPVGALVLLGLGAPAAAVFALIHGAGSGILTIPKGTLPLTLFGPQGYGERQGLMMVPARIAQALAPRLFGWCLELWDAKAPLVRATAAVPPALETVPGRAARREPTDEFAGRRPGARQVLTDCAPDGACHAPGVIRRPYGTPASAPALRSRSTCPRAVVERSVPSADSPQCARQAFVRDPPEPPHRL